jgi:hypothetical protein
VYGGFPFLQEWIQIPLKKKEWIQIDDKNASAAGLITITGVLLTVVKLATDR